jgi:hypothetical protein
MIYFISTQELIGLTKFDIVPSNHFASGYLLCVLTRMQMVLLNKL